jgi:hypothetical protein
MAEAPKRMIYSIVVPRGFLTKPGLPTMMVTTAICTKASRFDAVVTDADARLPAGLT